MNRSSRLQPVRTVVDNVERQHAKDLAASERRAAECEARLAELLKYESDYRRGYAQRAGTGIDSATLRDYQMFLARLGSAISQQSEIVNAAKAECVVRRKQWQEAARRAKSVEHVATQWRTEELRAADRREQGESDERAQQAFHRRSLNQGNASVVRERRP